ncbi:MAG TPA: hypothetical protein EYH44_01940 [Thermoprotei archaeon]|nr:hypothetical protein [Thermoprotei archaeon]
MDKRDLGIMMILGTYIYLLIKTIILYIEGNTDPIFIYRMIGSDPLLFLVNISLYLSGAYLLIGYANPEVRDSLINIIFFLIPAVTLIFIISYLWIAAGPRGLLQLYGTAQFPLYHIFLVILVGIATVIKKREVESNKIKYTLPFVVIIIVYSLIRLLLGIYALAVVAFLIIVGILTVYLTKKYFE